MTDAEILASGGQAPPIEQTSPAGPDATPVSFDPASPVTVSAPVGTALPGGVPNVASPAVAPGAAPVSLPPAPPAPGVDTRSLDQARDQAVKLAQAQQDSGAAKADLEQAKSDEAQSISDEERRQAVDVAAEEQAQKDGLAAARQSADEAQNEVKNFKFHDYWSDKSTGSKVIAGLGVLLGALGAGMQSRTNPAAQNMAMNAIEANIARDFDKQKQALATAEKFAAYKERGVQDLSAQYRDDLARLQIKQGLALKAVADEAKARLIAKGIPAAEAENNDIVQKFLTDAADKHAQGFQQLVRDKAQMALEKARLGVSYATLAETRREHDLAAGGREAALEEKAREADEKAAAKKEKDAEKDDARTIYINGKPAYLASSSKAVEGAKTQINKFDDAHRTLVELLDSGDILPRGDRYDRAVAAIAGTTIGNASDTMTKHESGALKGKFGLLDKDAIKRAISHLDERRENYLKEFKKIGSDDLHDKSESSPGLPSVEKIRAIKDPVLRQNATDAYAALTDPAKKERAAAYLAKIGKDL